jgi:hypothetical protein
MSITSLLWLVALIKSAFRRASKDAVERLPLKPNRKISAGGMCLAQQTDLKAAREGRISWLQYSVLWGRPSL